MRLISFKNLLHQALGYLILGSSQSFLITKRAIWWLEWMMRPFFISPSMLVWNRASIRIRTGRKCPNPSGQMILWPSEHICQNPWNLRHEVSKINYILLAVAIQKTKKSRFTWSVSESMMLESFLFRSELNSLGLTSLGVVLDIFDW